MRKKAYIVMLWILLPAVGSALAATTYTWDNDGGDNLWSNAVNWNPNLLPGIGNNINVALLTNGPVINSPTTATGLDIRIGATGGANLIMNSGVLNAGEWLMIGIDQSGQSGTFTMNGGTVNLGYTTPGNGHLWIAYSSSGTFTMNGGDINVPGRFGLGWNGGTATVQLNGGTIKAVYFSMASTSRIDITGCTLILTGDQQSTVNGYVNNNWITAYGGDGTVNIVYDSNGSGKTTVTAELNTQKARAPNPTNNAVNMPLNSILSWTAGVGAVSHNVYLGISQESPDFQGNETGTTFNPGLLAVDTTYFWRIDEVNGPNTVTGDLWTFNTTACQATDPNPADASMNVTLNPVLHWTGDVGAISHDVYFGTNVRDVRNAQRLTGDLNGDGFVNFYDILILADCWLADPTACDTYAGVDSDNIVNFNDFYLLANNWSSKASASFKGNTFVNSWTPGTLAPSTTYHWRIDEVNGPVTRKGNTWSFTTAAMDSNYSLVGKIMCGYQGWFNCPNDGTTRGWIHWSRSTSSFTPSTCTVDMWPDMNEMGSDEKFLASSFYDGNNYYVYSGHNLNTVLRHFQWMQQYGIDGIFLQRFATEVNPGTPEFYDRNDVLSYVKQGANQYGRKYAVMYDLSGLSAGGTSNVINDWKYLVDTVRVGRDPCDTAYIFYKGKPVVAVWGIGFSGRQYTSTECRDLIDFLKNDPVYGGNVIMIGVKDSWRTNSDPMVQATLQLADIISPWLVGSYSNTSGVNNWASSKGIPDKNWCNTYGKDYLPVMFPGFSWHNLNGGTLNQTPRMGGQFLWDQLKADISTVGANMLYVAMFDEVDEGTAIYKVSNNPPEPNGVPMFVTYNMDGYNLASDEYLWLVGQAARALRGEISPVPSTRPAR